MEECEGVRRRQKNEGREDDGGSGREIIKLKSTWRGMRVQRVK